VAFKAITSRRVAFGTPIQGSGFLGAHRPFSFSLDGLFFV